MRRTVKNLRERIPHRSGRHPWLQFVVRRLRVAATGAARWVLEGFEGGSDGATEEEKAEVFSGIGFASRPSAANRAEAVVLKVGAESGHPVIVATRDYDAVKVLLEGEGLKEDETAIFTNQAMVKITKDGEVLLGSIGGTFKALATADHQHPLPNLVGDTTYGSIGATKTGDPDDVTSKVKAE